MKKVQRGCTWGIFDVLVEFELVSDSDSKLGSLIGVPMIAYVEGARHALHGLVAALLTLQHAALGFSISYHYK